MESTFLSFRVCVYAPVLCLKHLGIWQHASLALCWTDCWRNLADASYPRANPLSVFVKDFLLYYVCILRGKPLVAETAHDKSLQEQEGAFGQVVDGLFILLQSDTEICFLLAMNCTIHTALVSCLMSCAPY